MFVVCVRRLYYYTDDNLFICVCDVRLNPVCERKLILRLVGIHTIILVQSAMCRTELYYLLRYI